MRLLRRSEMKQHQDFNQIDLKTLLDHVYYPARVLVRYDKSAEDNRIAKGVDGVIPGTTNHGTELFVYKEILEAIRDGLSDQFDEEPPNHLQQNFLDLLRDLARELDTFYDN